MPARDAWTLRLSAASALLIGAVLLLASWDGLYDALDLPQPLPALGAQIGGAALVGLAYALWASATRSEIVGVAAAAGAIAQGTSALDIAGWLIFRDAADLGIDSLGTVLLTATAVVLALLALALCRLVLGSWRR